MQNLSDRLSLDEPEVVEAQVCEQITGEDLALIGVGTVAMIGITLIGGAIVANAVLLALLTIGSAVVLWLKMPAKLGDIWGVRHLIRWTLPARGAARLSAFDWKALVMRHELVVDVIVSVGAFFVYGATITGMVAAGLAGLGISVMLRMRKVCALLVERAQAYNWATA